MFDRNHLAWASKLAEGRGPTPIEDMRASAGHHRPKSGDIVLAREAHHPRVRYTIGRFEKQAQLSFDSRDKALRMARAYATKERVDLWEQLAGRFASVAPRGFGQS